jgi:hypothetical protein
MKRLFGPVILAISAMATQAVAESGDLSFRSGTRQTDVIELFTSEGCSSCPPADAWLGEYVNHPDLFTKVIPIAFHVDYWNWLGWQDRFARKDYSDRQYAHVKAKHLSQAYTPGFLINNREWKAWFAGKRQWQPNDHEPGVLSLDIVQGIATLNFASEQSLRGHVAILGMGLESSVRNGENRGKTLRHDFVVLQVQQHRGQSTWQFRLPDLSTLETDHGAAIVAWVSTTDDPAIIQATGGYLPTKPR